jgi:transcriptional regulator with XRE-family HTH domain
MNFGTVLKSYRQVNRLNLRNCAKRLGLAVSTLSRIENGKPIDQATLLLLINWMFGVKEIKVSPNSSTNSKSVPCCDVCGGPLRSDGDCASRIAHLYGE